MISKEQMEELRKLKELLDAEILTKEEFEEKKAMILQENKSKEISDKPTVNETLESTPQKTEMESAPVVAEPKETEPLADTDEKDNIAAVKEECESAKDKEPIKMEMPENETYPGIAPVAKKKSIKPIIIGVVAAIVVLILIIAVIGGSGSSDSTNDSTGSGSSEYSQEEETEEPEPEPVLESISAEYSGDTEKGTVLDEYNDGITVTGTYDDGTTETLTNWTIEEPKTLKAGKTATVTISSDGQTCELEVTCTSVSKKEFIKSCKEISYNDLARNPDKNENKNIKIHGKIIQVLEGDDNSVNFRIGTKDSGYGNWYDDVFLVDYTYNDGESKYLEDDMVTMWGTYGGTYTYESTGGADITVPLLYAQYIKLD